MLENDVLKWKSGSCALKWRYYIDTEKTVKLAAVTVHHEKRFTNVVAWAGFSLGTEWFVCTVEAAYPARKCYGRLCKSNVLFLLTSVCSVLSSVFHMKHTAPVNSAIRLTQLAFFEGASFWQVCQSPRANFEWPPWRGGPLSAPASVWEVADAKVGILPWMKRSVRHRDVTYEWPMCPLKKRKER